jgi:hypothetical protein
MVPMADSALSYADPYGAPQAATQLRDEPCNDITSELHPSPKSGGKPRPMPDTVDSDDEYEGEGLHNDESPPSTKLGPETQSSTKPGHLATKAVSSFQHDSPTPIQERSVTTLVTWIRSLNADATAASTSTCTKSPFASSSAPENSHTPQQPKVGGDDERFQRIYPYPLKMMKLLRILSWTTPPG